MDQGNNLYFLDSFTFCTLYITHCTSIVLCTLYIVHCTLYSVHCALYTVLYTLYNVHLPLVFVLLFHSWVYIGGRRKGDQGTTLYLLTLHSFYYLVTRPSLVSSCTPQSHLHTQRPLPTPSKLSYPCYFFQWVLQRLRWLSVKGEVLRQLQELDKLVVRNLTFPWRNAWSITLCYLDGLLCVTPVHPKLLAQSGPMLRWDSRLYVVSLAGTVFRSAQSNIIQLLWDL
jgi:hypothetical protein